LPLKIGTRQHHLLAALIAERQKDQKPLPDEEASAVTGYSSVTIRKLRQQRPFQKLIKYYLDYLGPPILPEPFERMQALGLSTLEELQARLADAPGSFTKRELMEMAELLLVKAAQLRELPRQQQAGGVRVAIQFVEAHHAKTPSELEPPTVEHQVADNPPGAEVEYAKPQTRPDHLH